MYCFCKLQFVSFIYKSCDLSVALRFFIYCVYIISCYLFINYLKGLLDPDLYDQAGKPFFIIERRDAYVKVSIFYFVLLTRRKKERFYHEVIEI